ncbi:MAG: nucleoside-diphosphate kinase [Rhizobiaceae bacterium]
METRCLLTSKDYFILQAILDRGEIDPALVPPLRRKLASAAVVLRDDVPADVVTINSRIAYSVDGGACRSRLLVQGQGPDFPSFALSIRTPRGLALLGRAEGQAALIALGDGAYERLRVERLFHQPEADIRARQYGVATAPGADIG